jgi:photosystem II stability/assembly factor-like uncharacterized protein
MKINSLFTCWAFWASLLPLFSQKNPVPPTSWADRQRGFDRQQLLMGQSLVREVPFRSVGPTIMSGRIVDLDADPADPTHILVGYATGGLWETRDNGASFAPLTDALPNPVVGDLAVDWSRPGKPIVWLGTGENNSSRSSYAGNGIYRSADGGRTWRYLGLAESHHIGRIVLHPTDTNRAWAAVLGHLYSPSAERGVYRTTDGGRNWKRVLFANDSTGAIDLVADPRNPDILYAATWERDRRAWNFKESGPASGIYKTTDGGETWNLVTGPQSLFPQGAGIGRIGLAIHPSGILYAVLDNQTRRPKEKKDGPEGLSKDSLRTMSAAAFLELDDEALEKYLRRNGFPEEHTAASVKAQVRSGGLKPQALVEYLEEANAQLFDTDVVGAEVYRSDNGGQTWRRTHETPLDEVFFTYGYYFAQLRVAANDPDKLYLMGVPILASDDGGGTWRFIGGDNVHVDHHALWVNPARKGHLINGNDGGLNITYNDGAAWHRCNRPPVGQFYTVQVDLDEPYNIYGGLQDNGVWVGSSRYDNSSAWLMEGRYPYRELMGGDGMQVQVDPRDNETVYTGYQFGHCFRINRHSGAAKPITPRHELGERPLRFNWQTPIHLSVHQPDILYLGSHKVHRSLDQGDTWTVLSGDLTLGGRKGNVPYGTLTALHESPLRFGLLYTGSDDGLVHVSRDGGFSWQRVGESVLPAHRWVSRVQASAHVEGRVYAALNGYRWDDFKAYLYVSEDYGATWRALHDKLPNAPVNVVREDPENPEVLYVGTDNGLYVSVDRGATWMPFGKSLPPVAVHDLVVHPREGELVVGTHGRSLWIAPVREIQQLDSAARAAEVFAFEVPSTGFSANWGNGWSRWLPPDTPLVQLPVFLREGGQLSVRILSEGGTEVGAWGEKRSAGLHYLSYDLVIGEKTALALEKEFSKKQKKEKTPAAEPLEIKAAKNGKRYLPKGKYTVRYGLGKFSAETVWEID